MAFVAAVSGWESFAQLISVLLIFIFVLVLTYWTTRWIANYQKGQNIDRNIEVIETFRIAGGKYIQIVKVGEKYLVIAVCKDSVTLLAELPEDQVKRPGPSVMSGEGFQDVLEKAKKLIAKK